MSCTVNKNRRLSVSGVFQEVSSCSIIRFIGIIIVLVSTASFRSYQKTFIMKLPPLPVKPHN